ncbi:MAG: hypothetical protein IT310_12740 [Anaerolineales bacterium]|nr:hypothetical protein [Anaerolineales bacterium]
MLKNKRFLLILFLLIVAILICFPFLNFKRQPLPTKNVILYTLGNKDSYILDITTGRTLLVAPGLAGVAWSPSGKKVLYRNVFTEEETGGLWISESDGSHLQQVFSMADYPKMRIFRALWLTDRIVLLNLVDAHNIFSYKLEVDTMNLINMGENTRFDFTTPDGDYWIQTRFEEPNRFEIASFSKVYDSTQEIRYSYSAGDRPRAAYSPDGRRLVYPADTSLAGNKGDLWVCDVDKDGFSNMRFFVNVGSYAVDYQWSPDGKTLGVLNGSVFTLLDGETGKTLKEFQIKSKLTRFWWSPDSRSIITDDINDIWKLNLETGEIRNILNHEKVKSDIPILVVDWRFVPIP